MKFSHLSSFVCAGALLVPASLLAQTTTETAPDATETTEATPEPVAFDANSVVAKVNDTEITLGQLAFLYRALPAQYQQLPGDVLFPTLLDQVINQVLLAQEGEKQGLGESEAVKIAIANTRRDEIAAAVIRAEIEKAVSDEAVAKSYQERYTDIPAVPEFNASHILVKTEDEAKAIVTEIEGGADFAETAKAKSTGPSGPNGGLLGWFSTGQMVPTFEEAVVGLEVGKISAPVETQFGWHVIKLHEKREKPKPALEAVREEIVSGLRDTALRARIDGLREAAEIDKPETGIPGDAIKADLISDN